MNTLHTCFWCIHWIRTTDLINPKDGSLPTQNFCETWNRVTKAESGKECDRFEAKLIPPLVRSSS